MNKMIRFVNNTVQKARNLIYFFKAYNDSGAIPYDSLSDDFKKIIDKTNETLGE